MPCGGGSGCYDLGYIISQIIFKLGEEEFLIIYNKMAEKDKNGFKDFIRVGLEYGDNDYNGKIDNLRIDKVFPKLNKIVK